MTGAGDYDTEMFQRHDIDDAAIEAILSGTSAGEELAPLASFAEELRSMASGPVPAPSMQLATILAEGFSTEKGDLLATAASNVPGPAPQVAGLPKWRKTKVIGEFIAGLSVAAKAAFGVSMAAASVTAAGAAGVLPGPAQNAVAAAIAAATPFSFPDKAADNADFGRTVSTDARDGGVDGSEVSEDAKQNGDARRADAAGFGGAVSADARDGGVDGREVSEDAKQNGEARRADGAGQDGRPADPGQDGLDRANQTPAAGRAPTSVPAGRPITAGEPTTAGAPASTGPSTGMDTANGTPAAGSTPQSVPGSPATADQYRPEATGSQSSTGLGTAAGTPGGSHLPGSVPPAPPARR